MELTEDEKIKNVPKIAGIANEVLSYHMNMNDLVFHVIM